MVFDKRHLSYFKQLTLSAEPMLKWRSHPKSQILETDKGTNKPTFLMTYHSTYNTKLLRNNYPLLLCMCTSGIQKTGVYWTVILCLVSAQMKTIWGEKKLATNPWSIRRQIIKNHVEGDRATRSQKVEAVLVKQLGGTSLKRSYLYWHSFVWRRDPQLVTVATVKHNQYGNDSMGLRHYWNMVITSEW